MINVYFQDNKEYGAEDFNTVIGTLMSSGVVLPLADSESITPEDFNSIAAEAAEGGVIWDNTGLKVSFSDGIYYIAPGKAIMPDGAIVHSDETVQLEENRAAGFIYLARDNISYEYGFCFSESEIGDGLKLAEIDGEGVLYDRRVFAKTKLNVPFGNIYRTYNFKHDVTIPRGENDYGTEVYVETVDFGMPFKYVRFDGGTVSSADYVSDAISKTAVLSNGGRGRIEFQDGTVSQYTYLYFYLNGTAVDIYAKKFAYGAVSFDIELTFM